MSGWRSLDRDALPDTQLHALLAEADILSPWTVGRYRDTAGAKRHAERYWAPDLAWCRERGIDYLRVVFPGFSWHNLKGDQLVGLIDCVRLGGDGLTVPFILRISKA